MQGSGRRDSQYSVHMVDVRKIRMPQQQAASLAVGRAGSEHRQQAPCVLLSEQEHKKQSTTRCVHVIDWASHGKPNPLLGWKLTAHADL